MKKIWVLLGILAVIALAGCTQKHPMLGESCGTVTPGYQNECCANKMKDAIHPMCVGGWKYITEKDECSWLCETTAQITNFEECAAAGNPIMESYPRQCRANGQTFTEVLDETADQEQLIGGQRDEHGCLGPAGYGWNEEIGACIRQWELDDVQRRAAKTAVDHLGQAYGLTVDEVTAMGCTGCFTVKLSNTEQKRTEVEMENWEVTQVY